MNNFCLYRHTSPSGKCYVGITNMSPIKRWGLHGQKYLVTTKSGTPKHPAFYNAIIKYGWENIIHEVLFCNLSKEKACALEQSLIRHYKNLELSYNTTDGGEGIWGYKFTPKQLQKLSESHRGLKQSNETVAKRVLKNTGKHRTQQQKMKLGAGSKPVLQYSKDGEFLAEYYGVNEAQRITGIKGAHIGQCCSNTPNRRTAGGFIWRWKDDKLPIIQKPNILQYSKEGVFIAAYKTVKEAAKAIGIHPTGINKCIRGITKTAGSYVWMYKQ